MDIVKYETIGAEKWQSYIDGLMECPYVYSSIWIEFQKEYIIDHLVANECFLYFQDKKVVAIVKIFIERSEKGCNISWKNSFIEAPYICPASNEKCREKILKKIMKYIDDIAYRYQCQKAYFQFEVLNNPSFADYLYNYNWLVKFEYWDFSSLAQIIDLNRTENIIMGGYRKGTKSEIKKGKNLEIIYKDRLNIERSDIELCRKIYEYDAGRVTRMSELLDYYLALIQADKGNLLFAKLNGEYIAVMVSVYYHCSAYYLLYAEKTDRALDTSPGYSLQDKMIKVLKEKGVKYYNMGEQVFYKSHLEEEVSVKAYNISLYKRGFGGYTVPMFRGIKKYFETV